MRRFRRKPQRTVIGKTPVRSSLEAKVIADLEVRGVEFKYESERVPYTPAPKNYVPDLVLKGGKLLVEVKGWFTSADRSKHLRVKEQHPELDIRFVFGRAQNKLSKKSSTTYAAWCEKHGFKYAEGRVPDEWLSN